MDIAPAPASWPITIAGDVYDLAVTCNGVTFCTLDAWPQTLPGQLAAREAEILRLRAEVERLERLTSSALTVPVQALDKPVVASNAIACQYCGKSLAARGLRNHERLCRANPDRAVSNLEKLHQQPETNGAHPKAEALP